MNINNHRMCIQLGKTSQLYLTLNHGHYCDLAFPWCKSAAESLGLTQFRTNTYWGLTHHGITNYCCPFITERLR